MPIQYEVLEPHIVRITLDRPEKRNAMDLPHWFALANAWKAFRDDTEARVAIITGAGSTFCAGADLKTAVPVLDELRRQGITEMDGMSIDSGLEGTLKNLTIYKPIIAAVNGPCMAGGMDLLGGTDIRIACPEATFAVSEPLRGRMAGGGSTSRLPRQLPWTAAMEILLTCDPIPASRALELGLINEVVSRDQLDERALDWARRINKNAPIAIQATKEAALRGWRAGSIDEAYEIDAECAKRARNSSDAKEGPLAFVEKRPPVWTGR
jgi:enoyl-CoA hydratase